MQRRYKYIPFLYGGFRLWCLCKRGFWVQTTRLDKKKKKSLGKHCLCSQLSALQFKCCSSSSSRSSLEFTQNPFQIASLFSTWLAHGLAVITQRNTSNYKNLHACERGYCFTRGFSQTGLDFFHDENLQTMISERSCWVFLNDLNVLADDFLCACLCIFLWGRGVAWMGSKRLGFKRKTAVVSSTPPVCVRTEATALCIKCYCFGNSKPGALARRH